MKNLLLATIVTVLTSSAFACPDSEGFDLKLLNSAGEHIATLNTQSGEFTFQNKSVTIFEISGLRTKNSDKTGYSTETYSICKPSEGMCEEIKNFMEYKNTSVVADSLIITYKPFLKPIERSYMESVPTPRCVSSIK